MKTKLLALFALAFAGLAYADAPKVIIISPSDLVDAWKGYAKARTAGEYSVVNASDIYAKYSYTTGEAGAPRNPAESIHAFIRAKAAEGVGYFMLGGAWFDAQNLEKKVYYQGTDELIGLDNAIPGVYANVRDTTMVPSDLYYACHEGIPANGYPWDGDGDGVYLNDVTYTDGVTNYDLTPDVVVSRVALKSATGINGYWISLNGGSTDRAQMVANFSAKVKRLEDGSFGGYHNYSIIAGAVTGDAATEGNGLAALKREEFSFYDGLPNFFDADHAKVGNETTELMARRRIRDQIAPCRPIEKIDVMSAGAWSRDHADFNSARESYLATDRAFDMMYSHGLVYESVWMMAVGGAYLTPGVYGTMQGLTAFADYAGPCCGSTPDLSFTRNGKTYGDTSITDAMILNPTGGAVAAVGNTRGGWYDKSFTLEFDRDMSWILANRMLTGFVQEGKTAGETWKAAVASYVTDKRVANSTHLWLLIEDMLSGDPLVKLPAAEPDARNIGIETAATSLVLDAGSGYGGEGVVFTGAKGKLTLAGENPFYLGGLTNADLEIAGSNKTVDFDKCALTPSFSALTLATTAGTNNVIRSQTEKSFAKIKNNLYLRGGSSLTLATWNAFTGLTEGELTIASGAELVIAANPYRGTTPRRGESLNVKMSSVSRGSVRVAKGGYFTPAQNLATRVNYVVEAYDGLGGSVVVPSGASLELKQLPLVGVTGFDVKTGATLKLPAGAKLTDLLDCDCVATISKDAQVYVGETPLTLTKDEEIDGKDYVGEKVVYWKSGTAWNQTGVTFVNKYGEPTSYAGNEKIVIRDAAYPEMWIETFFNGATYEIDGGSVQVENEGQSRTTFDGATVVLVNGAKLNFRDRWNGVALVDTTITIADGCMIGEDATYPMRKPIDIRGTVKFLGDMTDVEFPHGFKLTDLQSTLTVSLLKDESLVVMSGVDGYKATAERLEDRVVYTLVEDPEYIRATAFGKAWTYVYRNGASLTNAANWGTVANGRFVDMASAPLLTGSNMWEPALFNGSYLSVVPGADGKKHIGTAPGDTSVEGWNLRIGLTNNVVVTFDDLAKFQGSSKYVYVDETSQLIVRKMTAKGNCDNSVDFHVAAENGIVFENGMKNGVACNYYLEKSGSISFSRGVVYNTHTIKSVAIELGAGETKTVRSRQLIALGGSATGATFALDANVAIGTEDSSVTPTVKGAPVTVDDPVGTCSLRPAADGIYLDYVGRKAATPLASRVVRAHPRLTRGLPRESLIGVRYTSGSVTVLASLTVKFDFTNCSASDLTQLTLWKMNDPAHAYAFAEGDATAIAYATIVDGIATFRPSGEVTVQEGDVLWVTAKINPDISADAEIRTAIGVDADMTNVKPHKVFSHYYRSGAYIRQDGFVAGSGFKVLNDESAKRVASLDDLILHKQESIASYDSDAIAELKRLRDEYHSDAMVRISCAIGAREMTEFATAEGRIAFIDGLLKVAIDNEIDGIDIDWEYPSSVAEWENYGLLMREFAEKCFDNGLVLSMCTNLGWKMPTWYEGGDKVKNVMHCADYIQSMAYGDKVLNSSPMVMINQGIKCVTDCGVPNRRIVVGQAIYAYEVQNPGWDKVVGWLETAYNSNQRRWDADLIWMHNEATKTDGTLLTTEKETFEGPSSYHAKIAWCREHDMGGAMSWGYYTDVNWDRADLMSLGRHHAKSLPMIANLPSAPALVDGVYQIATEADWNWLAKNGGVSAKLTADITFTYDPMMIGEWNGTLDGDNHTLTIPEDVWIAREGSTGLFGTIRNGRVKNLTIVLKGRVLTRASRWNDTTVAKDSTASTCPNEVYVGVLAAEIRASSKIENVTIELGAGAEVQGVYRTGALAGNVYAPEGAKLEIKNCKVAANGVVQNRNINSSETVLDPLENAKVDALVGHVQQPNGATTVYFSQTFALNADGSVSLVDADGSIVSNKETALDAYLLNCDLAELAEKKAAFKFTAEDLAALMRGEPLTTINGVEFNGKFTIEETEINGGKLYKATLTL